jgi:hypothetical protein
MPASGAQSDMQNPVICNWRCRNPKLPRGFAFRALIFDQLNLLYPLQDGGDTDSGESESPLIIQVKAEP